MYNFYSRKRCLQAGVKIKGGFLMAKIYVFLADGCEEVEALTPVDLLNRAGHEVCMVSVMQRPQITGAHGIKIEADALLEDQKFEDGDVFLLPGGMPGTRYLGENKILTELLLRQYEQGRHLAAICAAPSVLGELGILRGKKAVCYPGFEEKLSGAEVLMAPTITDGTVTTARGVGAGIDFGLELIRVLDGEEKARSVKEQIVYPYNG